MFHHDNKFMVKTFELIVKRLPPEIINEAIANGSYYDFHIKTDEYIIVPRSINFVFKYLHLIKEDNPEYWERVVAGWNKAMSPKFGDPLDPECRRRINEHYDNIIESDEFNILPPLERVDDDFFYFKNLESVATEVDVTYLMAAKFNKLYTTQVEHQWNSDVNVYLFPANDTCFYGLVDNKLTMVYPKWNSFRWSYEIPKFIINTENADKVIKFKEFDVNTEQFSIRIMNGMPDASLFGAK